MILKRLFDRTGAIILIVLLSPVMVVCAILVKCTSKGTVFFRQERMGLHGKVFRIMKFRTMYSDPIREKTGHVTFADDPQITKVGKFLRNYRLDELPQLFNVILGQMSLVGPRPLPPVYLHAYSDFDKRRLEAVPGITGWQQIHGASGNSWDERIQLDVWYVDNRSFLLDIQILCQTVWVVIRPTNVYDAEGQQMSGIPTALRESMQKQKQDQETKAIE